MEKYDEVARLMDIAREFRFAMLVTVADDAHLHGRPMTVAEVDDEAGAIWFLASKSSDSTAEIAHDGRAIVTMQSTDCYVQWSGHAELVDDPLRVHEVWRPEFSLWFPNGADDPKLQLVRVDVEVGEYWDQKGAMKIRALLRRARQAFESGGKPSRPDAAHGRVHGPIGQH